MALRSLKLRKQIDLVNKQLEELRTKAEALAVREAELEQAIAEAETDEDLNLAEEEIAKLEERDGEITEALSDPSIGTDLAKLRKLTDEQTEIQDKLAALYDEWEELSSEDN